MIAAAVGPPRQAPDSVRAGWDAAPRCAQAARPAVCRQLCGEGVEQRDGVGLVADWRGVSAVLFGG